MPLPLITDPGLDWLPRRADGSLCQRVDVQFLWGCQRWYSYAWDGDEPLVMGDVVRAPRPPRWSGDDYDGRARVVNARSGYEGPIRTLVGRV